MRLGHFAATEPFAIVSPNPSVDTFHREVDSLLRVVFGCAVLLWLPSVSGQAVAPSLSRDTRSGSPGALIASGRASGAKPLEPEPGEVQGEEVEVQSGDTASEIVVVRLPAEVSLEQMLVALLRRNSEVFVDGNVNRLPAGTVLKIPDPRMAAAIPLAEARRIIIEQNREYEAFRTFQTERFRATSDDRSNRAKALNPSFQFEAARPRGAGDDLTFKAPGELTGGGISEKVVASAVATPATAIVVSAPPVLESSTPLSPQTPASSLLVAGDSSPSTGFFSVLQWVIGFAGVAVAWRWFRAFRKAPSTKLSLQVKDPKEPALNSESHPDPASIPISEIATLPLERPMPLETAPDESKAVGVLPRASCSPKPVAIPSGSPPVANPRRNPVLKPVDATASSLPEPGRRQRLEEEAEMARLMAILSKDIAYRSGCEQALESRISRLSGLIQEDQRLNRKEGLASRSYRWLLMALAEPGIKENDPQRDLKLRLLIEIRDFNRVIQGQIVTVTEQP